jgi:P4 family phage/plasmid primase-like protien
MSSSLQEFLHQHRVGGNEIITHTSIQPNGKYFIPNEETRKFYYLYNQYIQKNKGHTILEIPISNYIPIIVDIDLKKEVKQNSEPKGNLYNLKNVKGIIETYMKILKEILVDVKDEDLCCFLMERDAYMEQKDLKSKKYIKNGFHLHFPRIFLTKIQIEVILMKKVKQYLKEENISLPNGLTYHNVIDESIYKGKGKPWFLYHSTKSLDIPPYTCSSVFLGNGTSKKDWKKFLRDGVFKCGENVEENLVDIFSIRGENKSEFYYEIKPDVQIMDDYIETNNQDIIEENEETKKFYSHDPRQDEWVDELLSLLPYSYSQDYNKWKHIGWILYNIYDGYDEGFHRWDQFSQQCKEKYSYNIVKNEWNIMEKKNITIGSLKHLVKKEKPDDYISLCNRFTEEYYKNSLYQCSTTHYDIAQILHLTYDNTFVCASVEKNLWYIFEDHIWKPVEDGVKLRNKISTDIVARYEEMRGGIIDGEKRDLERQKKSKEREKNKQLQKKQLELNDINDLESNPTLNLEDDKFKILEAKEEIKKIDKKIDDLEESISEINNQIELFSSKPVENGDTKEMKKKKPSKVEKLSKIIGNLKTRPFKNNVMAEARDMFYDENFLKKINADPWLIAFQNGVFDLKNKVFRDGEPMDYISMNVPIHYRSDLTLHSPQVQMVIDFFIKIFPDVSIRDYFLQIQSEIFVGRNQQKIFQIWTGDGDNGKSVTQDIFEKMLGQLCVKLPTSLLVGKRTQSSGACPELVRAGSGARMCILQEANNSDKINTGILKELSGNDSFYARGLHKDPIDINPMFKLVMICNKPPVIENSQNDQATWNRTRLIPFESTFPKDRSLVPETFEEQIEKKIFPRDQDFSDKIPDMLEGVAWYLLDIYKNRQGKIIVEPTKVLEATGEYRASNDTFKRYLDDKVEDCEEGRLSFFELYDSFKDWYRDSYPSQKPPNGPNMKEYLVKIWGKPNAKGGWARKKFFTENIN